MKITGIHIKKFGCFSDFDFLPSDKLNIIYAPNESGKTTLLDFVRYMFYGSDRRRKINGVSIKEKYMPHNGYEIGGTIEFSIDDVQYSLTRTDGIKQGEKTCSLFDKTNGRAVATDGEIGNLFFSMTEKMFFDTCFIADIHSISRTNSDGGLMAAVSGKGIDKTSYAKVKKRLNESCLSISSSKRSSSEFSEIKSGLERCRARITDLENQKNELEQKSKALPDIVRQADELERKKRLYTNASDVIKLNELRKQRGEEQRLLDSLKNSSQDKSDCDKYNESDESIFVLKQKCEKLKIMYLTVTVLFAVVSVFFFGFARSQIHVIAGGISALSALAAMLAVVVTVRRIGAYRRRIESFFDNAGVNSYNEYMEFKRSRVKESDISSGALATIEILKSNIDSLDSKIRQMISVLPDNCEKIENFVETNSFTNARLNDIIDKTDEQIRSLRLSIDDIERVSSELVSVNEKLSEAMSEYSEFKKRKESLDEKIKVYGYALQILESAFDTMKNNTAPVVCDGARKLLDRVCLGRYTAVATDKSFNSHVCIDNSFVSSLYLSQGTSDILDFSLRMSLVDIMSDKHVSLPVFMDDPFMTADDVRCAELMSFVLENSQSHQTFFTTCRSREGLFFENNSQVSIFSL